MDYSEIFTSVSRMIGHDPQFLAIQDTVNRLEPDYLRIMASLSEEDQALLSLYIAACEDADHYRMYPAYQLGLTRGRMER